MTLMEGATCAVKDCLKVKKGENFLIITDPEREKIGQALYMAGEEAGAEVQLVKMRPRSRHGEEPPAPLARLMKEVDACIAPTTFSLSHTQARKEACASGTRVATMPMILPRMMSSGGMTADFKEVDRRAKRLLKLMGKADAAHVTTPAGTDLRFSIQPKRWVADTGLLDKKGSFGNLPAGELFLAPDEGKTEGTLVIDGALAGVGRVDRPIRITVNDGQGRKIAGGASAAGFRKMLAAASRKLKRPDNVYNIAELGIGLNPKAKLIGNPLEDEKVMGTVHVALGDNSTFGGKVQAGIHVDGILLKPTLTVGGKLVMEGGKLKV
jgi:leucyl aminopeptidase (aminopeptidase T)